MALVEREVRQLEGLPPTAVRVELAGSHVSSTVSTATAGDMAVVARLGKAHPSPSPSPYPNPNPNASPNPKPNPNPNPKPDQVHWPERYVPKWGESQYRADKAAEG